MAFKSSILMESSLSSKKEESVNSISELANNNSESYLYNLLEFNDDIHTIHVKDRCNMYRALKEDAIAMDNGDNSMRAYTAYNEGIISTAIEKLTDFIEAIIKYIKKFIKMILNIGSNKKNVEDIKKETKENANKAPVNDNPDDIRNWPANKTKTFNFKVFNYPTLDVIDTQKFRDCITGVIKEIENVCKGQSNYQNSDNIISEAYSELAKAMQRYRNNSGRKFEGKVENAKALKDFVRTEICFVEEKNINYTDYEGIVNALKYFEPKLYADKAKALVPDLELSIRMIENNAASLTQMQYSYARALASKLKCITDEYTWFINYILKMQEDKSKYMQNMHNKISGVVNSTNESSSIHGEEFTSDTLFANADMDDFNRTEWLDLSLTTESFELKYQMQESYRRIALQEAIIMSDEKPKKFSRLIAMREAETGNLKDKMKAIFERIRKLFAEFASKIKDSNVQITKYIQKNKEFIDKPVKLGNAKSSGDILAGMYRIQQVLPIVPFNYETMKDDLKDKKVFFEKHILQSLKNPSQYTKRKVEWNSNISITEYCKAYYGASMPENKYPKCEFTTAELQTNMANIVKFVQTYSGSSYTNDINKLENESKKVVATPAPTNAGTTNIDSSKNESLYYSSLYGTWFNEIQVDKGETPENNNSSDNKSDNNNANSNETSKDLDQAAAFKAYSECYNDVFLSKLTATEFIMSELKSLIIAHAESHMNDEQKKNSRNMISGNQNQQQTQNTNTTATTGNK